MSAPTIDAAEEAFRAALEADAGRDTAASAPPAPPAVDPDAPHGRDAQGAPIAPYGFVKGTERPRLKPAGPGRGRAGTAATGAGAERPRVKDVPAAAAAAAVPDYTTRLDELGDGLWMLLSGFPVPIASVKLRVQAQAAILAMNKPVLVRSVNTMAQHSPAVARGVEALSTGTAAWVLPCMFGLAPFVGQSVAMWRAPAAGDVAELAAANEARFGAVLEGAAAELAAQSVMAEHFRIQDQADERAA